MLQDTRFEDATASQRTLHQAALARRAKFYSHSSNTELLQHIRAEKVRLALQTPAPDLVTAIKQDIAESDTGLQVRTVRSDESKVIYERVVLTRPYPLVATIQKAVCRYYGLPLKDMLSPVRTREIVRPRQIAMWLSKALTPNSLPEIGRRFGGKDHTTVLAAVRRVDALMYESAEIAQDVLELKELLSA